MRLSTGSNAPCLSAVDFLGNPVNLQALRGRPVLLSFYRYASCPVCNLRVHSVIQSYPAWAADGLAVVALFQSSGESIRQHVGRHDAPFPIVPDPDMEFYERFGVEARWRGLLSWRVVKAALRAFAKGYLPGRIDGPFQRTPADFLIDTEGRVALAHYGRDIDDHVPLETVSEWLSTQYV